VKRGTLTYRTSTQLTKEEYEKLGRLAEATHRSKSQVLRLLIEMAHLSGQSEITLDTTGPTDG